VLELISAIAARAGESVRRKGRYVSDKMLLSLLCAALPLDTESLAGTDVTCATRDRQVGVDAIGFVAWSPRFTSSRPT
jgi:hypothetical protein